MTQTLEGAPQQAPLIGEKESQAWYRNPDVHEVTLYLHSKRQWNTCGAVPVTFKCTGVKFGKNGWRLDLVRPNIPVVYQTPKEREALTDALRERLGPLVYPRVLSKYSVDRVVIFD